MTKGSSHLAEGVSWPTSPNDQSVVSEPLARSISSERITKPAESEPSRPRAAARRDSHNTARLRWEDHIIRDRQISAEAYRVGSFIAGHLNEKTRTAWPSVQLMQNALGLCRSVVFECVNELLEAGHLARRKRKISGNHNEYSLTHGPIDLTKRRPSRRGRTSAIADEPTAPKSVAPVDRSIVDRFLLEYPMSGKSEDVAAIAIEIARAVAVGHTLDDLLAAADRYRIFCARYRVRDDLIAAPDAFLADRRWLDGTLFPAADPGKPGA